MLVWSVLLSGLSGRWCNAHDCFSGSHWAKMRVEPDPPAPASPAEEAEQLAEALRCSLTLGEPASEVEEAEQLARALRRSLVEGEPGEEPSEVPRAAEAQRRPATPEAERPAAEAPARPAAPAAERPADGQPGGSSNTQEAPRRFPATAAQRYAAEMPREGQGFRFYAVWLVPGRPDARGVWWGEHPRCWRDLAACLPGGRYGPGVHLRGFSSWEAASAAYAAEAVQRGAPLPHPLHFVQ